MHKAKRLIHLMMLVNERKKFTIQELADEIGVSRRTMIRDLMELEELGVPLYSEVGASGGYRLLRESLLPPISFSEHEAVALFCAAQSLHSYRSLPFENEVASALSKLHRMLSQEIKDHIQQLQERLLFWVPTQAVDTPYLKQLLEAALQQSTVSILYDSNDKPRERRIQPHKIYAMNGLWYVQAYCLERGAIREFRADRVKSLMLLESESPTTDASPEHSLHEAHPSPNPQEDVLLPLEVQLTRLGVRRCQTDAWLSKGLQLSDDTNDGGADLTDAPLSKGPQLPDYSNDSGAHHSDVPSAKGIQLTDNAIDSGAYRMDVPQSKSLQLPDQADGGGSLRMDIPASYVPWAAQFFISLGKDAHVIQPAELRDQILAIATQVSQLYRGREDS